MFFKTQTYSNKSRKAYFLASLLLISTIFIAPVLKAQVQDFNFSGNDAESYQCFTLQGDLLTDKPTFDSALGEFYCLHDGVRIRAVLKPPALQELEVLFVRVVYAIWALVASFSFLLLIYLGYQYLISRGDPTQIKAIRERIIKYIIGFILVFLAVPILVTFFKLLGINNSVQCYQGLSGGNNIGIGFQFFYADLCTDPGAQGSEFSSCSDLTSNATGRDVGDVTGLTCTAGEPDRTCTTDKKTYFFKCVNSVWRFDKSTGQ
ncbi:MAG: pilin [Candidatus Dojkabacteria bacterium]